MFSAVLWTTLVALMSYTRTRGERPPLFLPVGILWIAEGLAGRKCLVPRLTLERVLATCAKFWRTGFVCTEKRRYFVGRTAASNGCYLSQHTFSFLRCVFFV